MSRILWCAQESVNGKITELDTHTCIVFGKKNFNHCEIGEIEINISELILSSV